MDYGIAIDIGTTTVCAALVALPDGNIRKEAARMNTGRLLGADVISRIKACIDGSSMMLQDMMRTDLTALLTTLVTPDVADHVRCIVIAGNTTMLHILRGYSCVGLGTFPYTAVTLAPEELKLKEVLPKVSFLAADTGVILFPGFTAFVGGDIVAGVYALMGEHCVKGTGTMTQVAECVIAPVPLTHESTTLMLDLGTNGEMALVEQSPRGAHRITVCSTAAGPVFEGGGISCGMGGIAGAIAHVKMASVQDGGPAATRCEVIGDGKPLGLCGTGVLETVAELRRAGYIDETGLMAEPYFTEGFPLVTAENSGTGNPIRFTQDDVRAVQMAKAAIRAGMETLLRAAGIAEESVDAVYVAGGYGQHMDFAAVAPLQMIPDALLPKCRAAGNTALKGCVKLLVDGMGTTQGTVPCATIADLALLASEKKEVVLAQEDDFEMRYYDAMNLPAIE